MAITLTALIAFSPQIKEFFNNLADPIGNATKKIEENNTQLEANKTKLEELEKTPWYDRTEDINNEIEKLKELNAELEKSNDKKQKSKASSKVISGSKTTWVILSEARYQRAWILGMWIQLLACRRLLKK